MTTPIFSTVCLLGAIGWAALTTYVLMFAGWGDGATTAPSNTARAVAYLPSAYLLLLFAAGFHRVPIRVVRSILVAAYFVLAVFTYGSLQIAQIGLVLPVPFIGFAIAAHKLLWLRKPK